MLATRDSHPSKASIEEKKVVKDFFVYFSSNKKWYKFNISKIPRYKHDLHSGLDIFSKLPKRKENPTGQELPWCPHHHRVQYLPVFLLKNQWTFIKRARKSANISYLHSTSVDMRTLRFYGHKPAISVLSCQCSFVHFFTLYFEKWNSNTKGWRENFVKTLFMSLSSGLFSVLLDFGPKIIITPRLFIPSKSNIIFICKNYIFPPSAKRKCSVLSQPFPNYFASLANT